MLRLGLVVVVLVLGGLWLVSHSFVQAQETQGATCEATLEGLWALATDACATGPVGYVCNGGSSPQVRPEGHVANALASVGALVETQQVTAVQTLPIITEVTGGGVLWLRLSDPYYATVLLVGEAVVFNLSAEASSAWGNLLLQTGVDRPDCSTTPHNTVVLQSQPNIRSILTVNGVIVELVGTVAVRTLDTNTVFVALAGQSSLTVLGQELPLWVGQQITVGYQAGNFAQPLGVIQTTAPLSPTLIENLPTGLLDQPIWLPQPGYLTTEGLVNLRAAPSTDSALVGQIPSGEVLTILGANPERTWFHVGMVNGFSGWVFGEVVKQFTGEIAQAYFETPTPPQRYGTYNSAAVVRAPSGLNLRANPSVVFPIVDILHNGEQVNMVARSPYSPWVKVTEDDGASGWVALVGLDTRSNVNALPVDNTVPVPETIVIEPTRAAGSFGNAFPDPNAPSF